MAIFSAYQILLNKIIIMIRRLSQLQYFSILAITEAILVTITGINRPKLCNNFSE